MAKSELRKSSASLVNEVAKIDKQLIQLNDLFTQKHKEMSDARNEQLGHLEAIEALPPQASNNNAKNVLKKLAMEARATADNVSKELEKIDNDRQLLTKKKNGLNGAIKQLQQA